MVSMLHNTILWAMHLLQHCFGVQIMVNLHHGIMFARCMNEKIYGKNVFDNEMCSATQIMLVDQPSTPNHGETWDWQVWSATIKLVHSKFHKYGADEIWPPCRFWSLYAQATLQS
jgi:hypothetical protein